jgi:hypothetical protein
MSPKPDTFGLDVTVPVELDPDLKLHRTETGEQVGAIVNEEVENGAKLQVNGVIMARPQLLRRSLMKSWLAYKA